MKQHLSTQDRNDIVSISCFADEVARIIADQNCRWDEDIIAEFRASMAYVNKGMLKIYQRLPSYEVEAVSKIADRHCVYIASRKHRPQDYELPISKDKLVDAGFAMLERCDTCTDEYRVNHQECGIFKFLNEYFDIDRGGKLCPYDSTKAVKEE